MTHNLINFVDTFFDDYRPMITNNLKVIYPTTSPSLNVTESDDSYKISVTIPGLDPKEIKVNLTENVLSISYDHKEETKTSTEEKAEITKKSDKLLREEYRHYSFSRSVSLPKNIDPNTVKADSKDGILTITVHKLPESKPKSVDINVG
jgi:HSP20 family protein